MMQGSLPTRLRVLRAERGLTLREAAALTDVRPGTLSELERGVRHPHDVTLSRIAKGYGVPVEELLEEEPVLAGKAEAPSLPEGAAAGPETQDLAAMLFGRVRQTLADHWLYWTQEVPPDTAAEVRAFADATAAVLEAPELREAASTDRALFEHSLSMRLLGKLREAAADLENADFPEERREALR